jgi:pantoate--beta-alanine ligase
MGALHDGHLALVKAAKAECRRAIVSIFVNPTQFGPSEDLAAYPRAEASDVAILAAAECDLVFAPHANEMYPERFATQVSVGGLADNLCGPFRPGHFAGVATIVTKLLNQAQPDRAYFGEKDFQQLQIIRRLATDLDLSVMIRGVPTMREADGLALSSRNRFLTAQERQIAAQLPAVMQATASDLADGRPAAGRLATAIQRLLDAGFTKIDYLKLCEEAGLTDIPAAIPAKAGPGSRLFVAAFLGRTRLIDNWPIPTG